jgi:hypothetical protein
MAKGISISIGADAKTFASAVKSDVLRPLDETVKALEDVNREGDDLNLEDRMRDSQRATARLKDENEELADAIRQAGRRGRDMGDDVKRGAREAERGVERAKAGVEDFKDEANDTAREAAASFDGSAESIGDAFQEIAANAFAGFGPAGAAAGLAAAAGLGVVTTVIADQTEAAAEFKSSIRDAYQAAVEEGRTYLDEAQIIAAVNDLIFDPENDSIYKQAEQDAERLGVKVNDFLAAQAGDLNAVNDLLAISKARAEEIADGYDGGRQITIAEAAELGHVIGRLEDKKAVIEEANQRARVGIDVQNQIGDAAASANQRARDTDAARWQAQAERYESFRQRVAGGVNVPVNVDDSGLTRIENRVRSLSGRVISVRVEGQTGAGRLIL